MDKNKFYENQMLVTNFLHYGKINNFAKFFIGFLGRKAINWMRKEVFEVFQVC